MYYYELTINLPQKIPVCQEWAFIIVVRSDNSVVGIREVTLVIQLWSRFAELSKLNKYGTQNSLFPASFISPHKDMTWWQKWRKCFSSEKSWCTEPHTQNIWNRVDCQRAEKKIQNTKRLKERFLTGWDRAKCGNFHGRLLFQATYHIKTNK